MIAMQQIVTNRPRDDVLTHKYRMQKPFFLGVWCWFSWDSRICICVHVCVCCHYSQLHIFQKALSRMSGHTFEQTHSFPSDDSFSTHYSQAGCTQSCMLIILTLHPTQSDQLYHYTPFSAAEWHVQLTDHPSWMVCPAGWTMWLNGMSSPHV